MRFLAALLLSVCVVAPARASWLMPQVERHVIARHHYTAHWRERRHHAEGWRVVRNTRRGPLHMVLSAADARPADCYGIPWCGCYLRHLLGIADKSFNLAEHWFKWGHSSSGPCAGCVAVSYHHVAYIAGGHPGDWIVKQGNPLRYGRDSLRWAVAYRAP